MRTASATASSLAVVPFPALSFSQTDFERMYNAVRPNPLPSIDAFKWVIIKGQTASHFTSLAMHKLAIAAKDILLEQGRVAEGAGLRVRGTKGEITNQLQSFVLATPSSKGSIATGVMAGSGGGVSANPAGGALSATLLSSLDTDCFFPNAMNERYSRGVLPSPSPSASRCMQPSLTRYGAPNLSPPSTAPTSFPQSLFPTAASALAQTSLVPAPTFAPSPANPFSFTGDANPSKGADARSLGQSGAAKDTSAPAALSKVGPSSTPPPPFWTVVSTLCDASLCLKGYQPYCSPLLPIVSEIKRLSVRAGCAHCNFDVPAEHLNAVSERRRRILVVPLQGGYQPAAWPKEAKDMYIYVNGVHYNQRWKRQWPRQHLQTSYLPVDITQHIDRRRQVQTINFTCGDFPLTVAIVVAWQVSEIDLAEALATRFVRPLDLAVMYRRMSGDEPPSGAGADDDDDVIVATEATMATLCPISRCRLSVPVRGDKCRHIQPIDLAPFLRNAHTACYWNCPKCDEPMRGDQLVIDVELMKAMRSLAIPRLWQFLQVRRKLPVSEESPAGTLLDAHHYEWVRWCKDVAVKGVDSSDEERDDEKKIASSGDNSGASLARPSGSSTSKQGARRAEVISLDD